MRSVTEQAALDEFLTTAELAGTDFTAEKINNVKIIHKDQKNPYLLSAAEERTVTQKHKANRKRLTVPRRPPWNERTTPQELDEKERESLLDWRRGLAELQESNDLLMTPFERNLEVWRQLWRVIERSDLVVQIVDARNPLMFRSEDLEKYVKEVNKAKKNLLLVNKADMMTLEQRRAWAAYFSREKIAFRFFSAELAREANEARVDLADEDEDNGEDGGVQLTDDVVEEEIAVDGFGKQVKVSEIHSGGEEDGQWEDDTDDGNSSDKEAPEMSEDESVRILTTGELEALFLEHAPNIDTGPDEKPRKVQIGLVGYPNVGKSSTINALIGAKKVSVSATPGKTKHFQTIHLSDKVILCDCPGLVFPNFATTKAELVCNGVLPIDQLREFTGPAALVAQRIPQAFLEAVYGMKIQVRPLEEGGTGIPTAEELLRAYAKARGFATQGQGQPDESRAARYILKDYVKGKLLFCHPPPTDPPTDEKQFNRELYDFAHLPQKRRAALALQISGDLASLEDPSSADDPDINPTPAITGEKGRQLDQKFFGPQGNAGHFSSPFQYTASSTGKNLTGRKLKTMVALEKGIDPSEVRTNTKKHFKRNKRKGKKAAGESAYD
jgi:large subunit GTPase 1